MSAAIIVRYASVADLDAMVELLRVLFAIETDFVFNDSKQRRGLNCLLQSSDVCVLVAECERLVVGMCTAQLLVSTAEGGLKAIIEDVVVAEGWRRRGIGIKLLAALEQWAVQNEVKRLDLLADKRNVSALEYYRHLGWKQTELIALQKIVTE